MKKEKNGSLEMKNLILINPNKKLITKHSEIIDEWVKKFEEVRRFGNIKENTIQQDIKRLRVFINYCLERLNKEPHELNYEEFIKFFNYLEKERKIKTTTQDKYFKLLSVFYKILHLKNLKEFTKFKNYCKEIGKFRRFEVEHYDDLSQKEVNLILDEILNRKSFTKSRDALIIRTAWDTGARIGEILNLTLKDIDMETGIIKLKNTKGYEVREAVCGLDTLEAIKKYIKEQRVVKTDDAPLFQNKDGEQVAYEWINKVFKGAVKSLQERGKIPKNRKIGIHSLRHGRIVDLLNKGYAIEVVGDLMGHKDVKTTMVYAHSGKRRKMMLQDIQRRLNE